MEWDSLTAEERGQLTARVVLVGSESTGKTTLCHELVRHYRGLGGAWKRTTWVAEFGREYTERKIANAGLLESEPDAEVHSAEWDAEDFALIATEQQRLEDAAAASGGPVLFADTDAWATQLWERRYLGAGSTAARDAVPVLPLRALYLLADVAGVPFTQDGIRDGENYRESMQNWFAEGLAERGENWVLISGTRSERLARSIRAVDGVLARDFPTLP